MRSFGISTALAAAILTIAVFSVSLTAGAPTYQPTPAPGDHNESLVVGAGATRMTRTFVVHIPPGFDGKAKVPLVIMLHGAGGSGEGAIPQTGWGAKSDREGFIAVFPDGTPPHPALPARFLLNPRLWNDGSGRGAIAVKDVDDLGFISAMIDFLEARYAADPARIYCTGFSNGASMTFSVGLNLSNRIAAIAPVSGHLFYTGKQLAYPVPLLFIIGTKDPLNPIDGGDVKLPVGRHSISPADRGFAQAVGADARLRTAGADGARQRRAGNHLRQLRQGRRGRVLPGPRIGACVARRKESAARKMGRPAERQSERDRRHLGIFQGASAGGRIESRSDHPQRLTRSVAGRFDDRSNVLHSTVV